MQDMGLDTWLQNKGKVSRDEVLDYIGENRLRYGEEIMGSPQEADLFRLAANDTADEVDLMIANDYTLYQQRKTLRPFVEEYRDNPTRETRDALRIELGAAGYPRNDLAHLFNERAAERVDFYRANPTEAGGARHKQYALEGGSDYQNNILTVPRKQVSEKEARGILGAADDAPPLSKSDINYATHKKYGGVYTSPPSHYDQSNIGLTTRTQSFNTPQGDSVHLMDELQSDWHKTGKKKGYRDAATQKPMLDWEAKNKQLYDENKRLSNAIENNVLRYELEPDPIKAELLRNEALKNNSIILQKKDAIIKEIEAMGERPLGGQVPDAPAKQSWINQGIKKEINQTIADGRDYFAWTGGDIQADRYSLSEHIEGLEVLPSFEDGMVDVLIKPKGQDYQGISDGIIPKEDLHRYVGKEMADKALAHLDATSSYNQADLDAVINSFGDEDIMEAWVEKTPKTATYPNGQWQGGFRHPDVFEGDTLSTGHGTTEQEAFDILEKDFREIAKMSFAEPEPFSAEGLDLKVGGEGMKSFYDKDVKKRTEKIIKRLDPNAKVEVIELDNGNKVWGVKITDKMRDKVKSEGMPLYSVAPIAGAGLLGAGMMQQEDQQPQQGLLN